MTVFSNSSKEQATQQHWARQDPGAEAGKEGEGGRGGSSLVGGRGAGLWGGISLVPGAGTGGGRAGERGRRRIPTRQYASFETIVTNAANRNLVCQWAPGGHFKDFFPQ